jgi:hypothetical protein
MIEILVALFIAVMVVTAFTASSSSMFASTRQELEQSMDMIKRAVRFSSDEAILRNRIVRISLNLDTKPQTMSVDYGPDEKFILPNFLQDDVSKLGIREREERQKKEKKLEQSFTAVKEFQENAYQFNENITIVAVGSTLTNALFDEGNISLFFYPNGEKDGAHITFTSGEEMATINYESFTRKIDEEFSNVTEFFDDLELQTNSYQEWAKGSFDQWIK